MRILLLTLSLLLMLNSGAVNRDSIVDRIFNLSYNMEYTKAELMLEHNRYALDAVYYSVLDIDMSYWKNVTGTHSPDYPAFEATLRQYTSDETKGKDKKNIQLIGLSYQLRYEAKRLKLLSAISTHKKTQDLFEELKTEAEMENPELFQLYSSMYLYFSNYIKPFGGKSKNENCRQAISVMRRLTDSQDTMVKTLSSYFLGRTYLKYENDPEHAIQLFRYLTDCYPGNKKFPELLEECENKAK